MRTKDFYFDLPEELVAQVPSGERGRDRLLVMDRKPHALTDCDFAGIVEQVAPGTVMVFNNSRVRKARLYAEAESSGHQAEFLLLQMLSFDPVDGSPAAPGLCWKAMVRNAKRHKCGRSYRFADGTTAVIVSDPADSLSGSEFRFIRFSRPVDDLWLDSHGHIPLPPYIHREDEAVDAERYQTVYAGAVGSVAAPTAGLHFTPEILAELDRRGIIRREVTLHVGLGTFLPVRAEYIADHTMHEECYAVPEETARAVTQARREGRPVLAVGTTSIRTLESAWDVESAVLRSGEGATDIFIYPGYTFRVVDQVFTNFHTPESTLLMLVSAFAGRDEILNAYRHAVGQRYRFFSYGDAMLIR